MAIQMPGSGTVNGEPNVTPMIDVLLVLLIIFMIIIPLSRRAIDVQLPDPTPPSNAHADVPIVLELHPAGVMDINHQPVTRAGLVTRLHAIYDQRPNKIIFVNADSTMKYQDVVSAMDAARAAGVKIIGIPPRSS